MSPRFRVELQTESAEPSYLDYDEDSYEEALEEYNDQCAVPGVLAQLIDLGTGEVIGDGEPLDFEDDED